MIFYSQWRIQVKDKFSNYLKSKKEIIRRLIDRLSITYAFVSVLGTDVSGTTVTVDKTSANVVPSGLTESGFVIKIYNGKTYNELSINEINESNIESIINQIDLLAQMKGSIESIDVDILQEEKMTKRFYRENYGMLFTVEEIIDILRNYVNRTISS